ncbi:hypothetical protein [Robiginitalea sp. SC105]|uniref:hypothetical protein n=1 Tax=Robiginitalea sp. SC105 TaxID=2762332 RepID=UPI00163A1F5D|nr:hypothetical protein [Robiginitalea sp. SC105]MBC2839423.1 hypothetical protein [Robiginitalea sp. SC105]
MKKFTLIFFLFTGLAGLVSCSSNDDGPETTFEQLVITEAGLPASFNLGELYEIPITYELPDGCTQFFTLNVGSPTQNIREVVAIGSRTDSGGCTQAVSEGTETLIFQVLFNQTYTFRFWQGDDANGNPQFLEVEVPVVE